MKVFSNVAHYREEDRYSLNNITKALWNPLGPEERRRVYGNWTDLFEYEPDIAKADFCLLTHHWNHYVLHGRIPAAESEALAAKNADKPLVVFNGGDFPARLPFEDVVLFESAGYRSAPGYHYHSAQPSFINDYVESFCEGHLQHRQKSDQPVVGFCGQASTSPLLTAFRALRLRRRQRQFETGQLLYEPAPFETTSFRSRVLRAFQDQPGIQTNYCVRSRYKGGDQGNTELQKKQKQEFVRNVLSSDYTLCMRGGGNFSVRFYETLCLGRIPVFIDTDCLLPFQDEIDYQTLFPWISSSDLDYAPEILRAFHAHLSNEEFLALQRLCRWLWQEHMTPSGFYQDFAQKMRKLIQSGSPN